MNKIAIIIGIMVALGIGRVQATDWRTVATVYVYSEANQNIWQCLEGGYPPVCMGATAPHTIRVCGTWVHQFDTTWHGVNCIPTAYPSYIYWMYDTPSGQYYKVDQWKAYPNGTCDSGYYSETSLLAVSRNCARNRVEMIQELMQDLVNSLMGNTAKVEGDK